MKFLIVEPFFSGSHRAWAEGYAEVSKHEIEILSLPGRFWKWRMHGGAVTLSKKFKKLNFDPDLIIATDMLNLPVFQSLIKPKCPVVTYFHENQFTYPWSPKDKDIELQRDKHYGFINYSTALSSDHIFFNSEFHLNSFFTGLEDFLRQFPDYRDMQNVDHIKKKSSTLHLGMNLKKFDIYKNTEQTNKKPLILWNHRWEHDKNPEEFFQVLYEISKLGLEFDLAVLGQEFKNELPIFTKYRDLLKKHIIQFGYTDSFEEYAKWLWKADILPITSKQDFFGGSIMEAVYCNTLPLLPKRLTYPELFLDKENPNLFYNDNELLSNLKFTLENFRSLKESNNLRIAEKYDWSNMVRDYDNSFEKIAS